MHNPRDSLISIKKEIQEINPKSQLIVVTKTFGMNKIEPLIDIKPEIGSKIKNDQIESSTQTH